MLDGLGIETGVSIDAVTAASLALEPVSDTRCRPLRAGGAGTAAALGLITLAVGWAASGAAKACACPRESRDA